MYVYIASCLNVDFIKIGISADPQRRLGELQRSSPYTVSIAYLIECADSSVAQQLEKLLPKLQSSLLTHYCLFQENSPYQTDRQHQTNPQINPALLGKKSKLGIRQTTHVYTCLAETPLNKWRRRVSIQAM